MYRTHFLSIVTLIVVFGLLAAPPAMAQTWQWGIRGNGNYVHHNASDEIKTMTTDPNGNVYIATEIKHVSIDGDVDGHPVTGLPPIPAEPGGHNVSVLSSFDCRGNMRWMLPMFATYRSPYPPPYNRLNNGCGIMSMGADSLGGIYLLLATSGEQLDAKTTLSTTTGDTVIQDHGKFELLVKYDTSGQLKWVNWVVDSFNISAGINSAFFKMAVGPGGHIYLFGYLKPATYHNSAFPVSDSGYYVVQYNKNGICTGGTKLDITAQRGSLSSNAYFSMDFKLHRYYFTGLYNTYTHPLLKFGNTQIQHPAFIGCLNKEGHALWAEQSSLTQAGLGIGAPAAIDKRHHVYVIGSTHPGDKWQGHPLVNNSVGSLSSPFIIAMDSSGHTLWATNTSSWSTSYDKGIVVNNNKIIGFGLSSLLKWGRGSHEFLGNSNYKIILPQLSKTTGQLLRMDTSIAAPGLKDYPTGSIVSKEGAVFVAGIFDQVLYVAGDTLVSRGGVAGEDWFLAKFATDCHCPAPQADFAVSLADNQAHFSYTGSGQVDSLRWRFGDSTTATGQSVTHTYQDTGTYAVCVVAYNSCGQNTYCQYVTVAPNTGIQHFAGFHSLTAYPNPTHQDLHLTGFRGKLHYQIIGRLGRTLRHGVLQAGQADIDLSGLAPGLYFLKVQNEQGKVGRMKVVKE